MYVCYLCKWTGILEGENWILCLFVSSLTPSGMLYAPSAVKQYLLNNIPHRILLMPLHYGPRENVAWKATVHFPILEYLVKCYSSDISRACRLNVSWCVHWLAVCVPLHVCSIWCACVGEPIAFTSNIGNVNQFLWLRVKSTVWVTDILLWMEDCNTSLRNH